MGSVLNCILNCLFFWTAIFGNSIIILAILKTRGLHSPSFVLLCCLAVSDLLVGLVCQPSFVVLKIAELMEDFSIYCKLRKIQASFNWIAGGVSLLTLCGVAVERFLALTLHLRYNVFITVTRVLITVLVFWILCIACVTLRFWVRNLIVVPAIICPVTFFIMTLSTLKIAYVVRKHQRQIAGQQQRAAVLRNITLMDVLRFRKSAVTVIYVYSFFLIFYFPLFVVIIFQTLRGYTRAVRIAYDFTTTAVFINSSLNPMIYCWRLREIRSAVRKTMRKRRGVGATASQPAVL